MNDPYIRSKEDQWKQRTKADKIKGGTQFTNTKADRMCEVNSEMIFQHKDMKKHTKGYDQITGEIEKRGKPCEKDIFLKNGEKDPTPDEVRKQAKKIKAKRDEAFNKKLYKQRLSTKWDRSW